MENMSVYKISAVGAVLSVLLIIVLAALPWPFEFQFPGDAVLAGAVSLSAQEIVAFKESFRLFLFVDSLFVVCWVTAWVGIGMIARRRDSSLGTVVLVVGLMAPILDFTENEMLHAAVQSFTVGQTTDPLYLMVWHVVRQLSYLLTYSAGAVAGVAVWNSGRWGRALSVVGLIGFAPALAGLFYSDLFVLSNLWYVVWFSCGAVVLWKAEKA